jgi:diguanylate cyclase (GGDEF)-like protein
LQVVLRGWWLILPALLIAVSSALVFTYSQTPIYRTSATFVVSPGSSFDSVSEVIRSLDTLTKRDSILATYAHIAASNVILKAVYQELELSAEQKENLSVSSELVPPTNIIKVIVESDDPVLAQTCATLVGQKTIEYIDNLEEAYDMKPLDSAFVPVSPSKPDKMQNIMLAVILGSVAGIASVFVLEYLRSSGEAIADVTIMDRDIGIYNRHYLLQRLGAELSRAKRHRYPLSLALMNVERLDVIKDMHLPRLRNEALRRVGIFLKQYLREEDLVARFEGDTFAVLLPDTSGPDAERLLNKLHTRMEWSIFELEEAGVKLNLSATSGVVAYDFNGTGRDELVARAKKALQRASDNGYGKVCLLEDSEGMDVRQSEPAIE